MLSSSPFIIIWMACLTDSSYLLISMGFIPASTSNASKLAVPGTPKTRFSNAAQLLICHTAAAYSNCGVTKALYSCSIHFAFIASVSFTFLNNIGTLLGTTFNAFCSSFYVCYSKFIFSSRVTPSNFGVRSCLIVWSFMVKLY